MVDKGLGPAAVVSGRRQPRGPQELSRSGSARAAERHGVPGLRSAEPPAGLRFVVFPLRLGFVRFPAESDIRLGEVRLVAVIGQVWLRFPGIPGSSGAALPLPAPRWMGDLAGPRFPPLRDVFLQVQDPEFYLRELTVTIIDKIFESLVRRHHPRPIACTGALQADADEGRAPGRRTRAAH